MKPGKPIAIALTCSLLITGTAVNAKQTKKPTIKTKKITEKVKIKYQIYNKYTVDPTDVSCTSQNTNGQKEITLITCTDDSKQRVIVKAKAI